MKEGKALTLAQENKLLYDKIEEMKAEHSRTVFHLCAERDNYKEELLNVFRRLFDHEHRKELPF